MYNALNFLQYSVVEIYFSILMYLCTMQVWNLGSSSPNFTLEGHEKGVNCIDYYYGGDKPYLISGADDRLVKIWDYQVSTYTFKWLLPECIFVFDLDVVVHN